MMLQTDIGRIWGRHGEYHHHDHHCFRRINVLTFADGESARDVRAVMNYTRRLSVARVCVWCQRARVWWLLRGAPWWHAPVSQPL